MCHSKSRCRLAPSSRPSPSPAGAEHEPGGTWEHGGTNEPADFDTLLQAGMLDEPVATCPQPRPPRRLVARRAAAPAERRTAGHRCGQVRVTTERGGRPALDKRLERGSLFGTVGFLDDGIRAATCAAATEVSVAQLDRAAFNVLFQSHHAVSASFQLLVARQLVADLRALDARLQRALREG